jgi:hypothetical protein
MAARWAWGPGAHSGFGWRSAAAGHWLLLVSGRQHSRRRLPPLPKSTQPNPHDPAPIQRLAQGEWFTARVASCAAFTIAYPRAPPATRAELRQLYGQLCRDETPMVRRAAAQRLGAFAAVVEPEFVSGELLPLYTELTGDGEQRCLFGLGPAPSDVVRRGRCFQVAWAAGSGSGIRVANLSAHLINLLSSPPPPHLKTNPRPRQRPPPGRRELQRLCARPRPRRPPREPAADRPEVCQRQVVARAVQRGAAAGGAL